MHFSLRHRLSYHYSQPVLLTPHRVCLRPRCDLSQRLEQFNLEVAPMPQQQTNRVDLEGNAVIGLSFAEPTEKLIITTTASVTTLRTNPFDFLMDAWAMNFPLDYPSSLRSQLYPYLNPNSPLDPEAVQLAQALAMETNNVVLDFVTLLNQTLYRDCTYQHREQGAPWPAGVTWRRRSGSCRDVTVLFMEVCRAVGLAARFVSGYQAGDPDMEHRQLHAWPEVYLPGAGWRGYDPTHGLAVADGHIALVAAPDPAYAAPVEGSFRTLAHSNVVSAEMTYDLQMKLS